MKTKIIEIIDETNETKTFRLEKPTDFDFTPGQYCLVSIPNKKEFKNLKRPITFSSSPTEDFIDITVKIHAEFTKALFELKPGDFLEIQGPMKSKLELDESAKEIVCVAGGSGITPFMSAVRYSNQKKLGTKFTFFYINKTEKDVIFKKELENTKNIKFVKMLTREDSSWADEKGYLRKELIQKYVENPEKKLWYICGPPRMVEGVKNVLEEAKIPEENKRFDVWQMPSKKESLNKEDEQEVQNKEVAGISNKEDNKMVELNQVYKCSLCGNIVEVLHVGGGELVCCGKPMELLKENSKEFEGNEKHVPIIEESENGIKVKVGSVPHPMEEKHYIEFIEVLDGDTLLARKMLKPGDAPEAEFCIKQSDNLRAREFCNLHGFWQG